jgi:hypothetical protein
MSLSGWIPGRLVAWKSRFCELACEMLTTAGLGERARRRCRMARPREKASSAVKCERTRESSSWVMEGSWT